MTVTVNNIIPAKQAEATDTLQYTAVNCKTIVDKFTATNTTGSAATITVNIVPAGGSVSASNTIVFAKSVAPGETYLCPEMVGQIIDSNATIYTIAGTASALTIAASGREVT